ncbi:MAG: hypothetical protein JXA78_17010 [Anaerolineales bacterium]|nr:hypothetical protein [Anaerolineales bacterium]
MSPKIDFAALYSRFDAPITAFDCGAYCAMHNRNGAPFCCDTRHAVPAVYRDEWQYLHASTDLWRPWQGRSEAETRRLQADTPQEMLLLECKGHLLCQRDFRSLSCRAFPFFPYITREGWFVGMTYYWQFENQCWVISNLEVVTAQYRAEFIAAFDDLLYRIPGELDCYRDLSASMRRVFSRWKRAIPLLHRNGGFYKVTPRNGRMRRADPAWLPKFGPYKMN